MSWGVDSYGFMQLSPFVRCNSHWVRDFFPIDDAETLKDANRTGAYKHQPIVKILPNYTESELLSVAKRKELEKEQRMAAREFARRVKWQRSQPRPPREKEYLDSRAIKLGLEEDARLRRKELAAWRKGKSSRARYKPNDGVLGHSPPEPSWGDGRTSWVEAFPDTWDHLTFQDVLLVKQLANPSKNDPPQVKKLIEKIKIALKVEMMEATRPPQVAQGWKNFFAALEQIAPLRENLKEINYDI
jgi:hypothetical protein